MRTNYTPCLMSACVGAGLALLSVACASDDSKPAVVGSGKVQELTIEAMFVERVSISLPFHTLVYNGEPRKLMVRGEDNLIKRITVKEIEVGKWQFSAPNDVMFTQHADIELEIPYIDMVEIGVDNKHVEFVDKPAMVWTGAQM